MDPDTQAPFAPRLVTGASFKALSDPEVVLQTTLGNVRLELNTALAGTTVANMLAYVNAGFYDGTLFHRVIPGFMAQGGGLTPGLQVQVPDFAPIPLESTNGLSNLRGTLAMARTNLPDTATAQFFINLVDNTFLNYSSPTLSGYGYAVFGKVVTGMAVIDSMAAMPTTSMSPHFDVPVTDIVIASAIQTVVGSTVSVDGVFAVAGLEAGGRFEFSLDGGSTWTTGSGNSFTAPTGSYAAMAIQVRQYDAANNQSLTTRFADALNVNLANVVTPNHAPVGSVRVTGSATLGQSLNADIATLSDADGPGTLGSPTFQWLRAGEYVVGATASTYLLGAADIGASISVRVTYTDGLGRVENVLSTGASLGGDDSSNLLSGSDFADVLNGLDGNDTLAGGLGADTMTGGPGDDVYFVDNASDRAIESANGGIDEVRTSINYPTYPTALGANVENIVLLGTGNIYGLGNSLNNSMIGNPGANILIASTGNDTLDGGAGNDTLDGGDGHDSMNGGSGFDSLIGGPGDDRMNGGNNADQLSAGAGNDSLFGGKSADLLDGGDGDDLLYGQVGDDSLYGGNGSDTADYSTGDAVTVNLVNGIGGSTVSVVGVFNGTDTLLSIENVIGSAFADSLFGDLGINVLTGGAGNDTLSSSDGPDTLSGGDGDDVIAGGAGGDSILGGIGHDIISGGKGGDRIFGEDGDDTLNGNLGNDQMTGGAGADKFVFNAVLSVASNVDTILDFQAGLDVIQLSATIFTAFNMQIAQTIGTNAALLYDSATGVLSYDADGVGGAAATSFAILGSGAHPGALGNDFHIVA